MSPRVNSSSSGAIHRTSAPAPYPRRSAGQPKSSRQQFSACGACRMRRVRCDLKDLPYENSVPHPACSNCSERGLKCVDEFAEVKAVKLLRRGRRLQQVEAIYGKAEDDVSASPIASPSPTSFPRSIIPQLDPGFFTSKFWQRFSVRRPVLEPTDFPARYYAHVNGQCTLGADGLLISSLLVIWAYSFGVDEQGNENSSSQHTAQDGSPNGASAFKQLSPQRLETLNAMLREILELIDSYGIMRLPTWDGVRALLLAIPLMDDLQLPVDRLVMNQTVLIQIDALSSCTSLRPPSSPTNYSGPSDALVCARVVWYAYVHESMTTGLHGGRLILNEDLESLKFTIPHLGSVGLEGSSGLPSPVPPSARVPHSFAQPGGSGLHTPNRDSRSPSQELFRVHHLFTIPMQLSSICRKIHELLTCPKSKSRASVANFVNEQGVRDIWEGLEWCWDHFNSLCRGAVKDWEVERFVAGWKIFIFECHNIVREALKEISLSQSIPSRQDSPVARSQSSASSVCSSSTQTQTLTPSQLYMSATRKCHRVLPHVISIIKSHVLTPDETGVTGGLFKWDTGLVRDGCFFAGFLAAGGGIDTMRLNSGPKIEDGDDYLINEESVLICLRALNEMRWECSKSEDRAQTVHMVLEAHRLRLRQRDLELPTPDSTVSVQSSRGATSEHAHPSLSIKRPELSPVVVSPHIVVPEQSGSPSWPLYTPPGSTSPGRGVETSIFRSSQSSESHDYKADDTFYHGAIGMDDFTFDPPDLQAASHEFVHFQHRSQQRLTQSSSSNHVNPSVFSGSSTTPMALDLSARSGHYHYAEDNSTFYH